MNNFSNVPRRDSESMTKNILFIMFDQLRYDYLSCVGHQTLETPNIDRLASMGVRFSNCYVQSPVCGASRMSTYTGRYVSSHGAAWNNVPLKVGELTLGDHLRKAGMDCWLIGKTHMKVDAEGMERLGLVRDSVIGARVSEAGFDVWLRDDGLWAYGPDGHYDNKVSPYNNFLKSKGYEGDNPWADFANAGVDKDDQMTSGWFMKYAGTAANIREEDSETPWLTNEAMKFIDTQGDKPWLCHLSYIKPHWPYIVPAPYNDMYTAADVPDAIRDDVERDDPHPVYKAFMENTIGKTFSRDEVRETVIPAYMGLIKQCDDQMGRLFKYLENSGQMEKKPEELKGGSFTVSSLGGIGGTNFTPIINPPEVAIMGISKSSWKPLYNHENKEIIPSFVMPYSLSYDHRVIDGALGASFTTFFSRSLLDVSTFE